MADETAQTAPESASPASESLTTLTAPTVPALPAVAPAAGFITYVVKHRLEHDGVAYAPGATFQHPDATVTAALRKAKAIALQTEVMAADDVAARMAAKEAETEMLRAELARLRAAQEQSANVASAASAAAQPTSGGKGGK